jgi:hypothetical protein
MHTTMAVDTATIPHPLTLGFCRTAETAALRFHVLNQLLRSSISLDSVRAWAHTMPHQ